VFSGHEKEEWHVVRGPEHEESMSLEGLNRTKTCN
jgi:hypothetical protein